MKEVFPAMPPSPLPARQSGRQNHTSQLHLAQPKTVAAPRTLKQLVAPPVYRPQPTPHVLQRKAIAKQPPLGGRAKTLQAKVAQSPSQNDGLKMKQKQPAAPPVYRPQPVPKVLQRKMPAAHALANQPRHAPIAPPVYRPQSVPKVLQAKKPSAQQHRPQVSTNPANSQRVCDRKAGTVNVLQRSQSPTPFSSKVAATGVIQRTLWVWKNGKWEAASTTTGSPQLPPFQGKTEGEQYNDETGDHWEPAVASPSSAAAASSSPVTTGGLQSATFASPVRIFLDTVFHELQRGEYNGMEVKQVEKQLYEKYSQWGSSSSIDDEWEFGPRISDESSTYRIMFRVEPNEQGDAFQKAAIDFINGNKPLFSSYKFISPQAARASRHDPFIIYTPTDPANSIYDYLRELAQAYGQQGGLRRGVTALYTEQAPYFYVGAQPTQEQKKEGAKSFGTKYTLQIANAVGWAVMAMRGVTFTREDFDNAVQYHFGKFGIS